MRTPSNWWIVHALIACLMLLVGGSCLTGCAGPAARDNVGLPALPLTEPGVADDIAIGIGTLPEPDRPVATAKLETFRSALASGDRSVVREEAWPRWAELRGYADAGIAARVESGEIGPGVAKSLTERLDRFGEVLAKTAGPDP